jgi:hypothetical protein
MAVHYSSILANSLDEVSQTGAGTMPRGVVGFDVAADRDHQLTDSGLVHFVHDHLAETMTST